jgi:hypothetical protein
LCNAERDTLFIISNDRKTAVVETKTGTVPKTIDISFLHPLAPAGIVYAPGSQNPAVKNLYIADQGFDCRPPTADRSLLSAVGGQNPWRTYAKLY